VNLAAADADTLGELAYSFTDTVLGPVAPAGGNVDQVVLGLPGEPASFDAAALSQLFTVDSGSVFAAAVAGSVVKEIADNAQLRNGVAHGGATATLELGSSTGPALIVSQSGSGPAVSVTGSDTAVELHGSVKALYLHSSLEALSVVGTVTTLLAKFFTEDSGQVYAGAAAGSVVKEIADNASGGGGGGSDPWATDLAAGGYTATQAGALVNGLVVSAIDVGSRLPAALVAGKIDAHVGSMADGVVTESKITVPAVATGPAAGILGMVQQIWRRFFKRTVKDKDALTIKTYADDGTTVKTTQAYTSDTHTDDLGAAS
jgi:hypothetical protein